MRPVDLLLALPALLLAISLIAIVGPGDSWWRSRHRGHLPADPGAGRRGSVVGRGRAYVDGARARGVSRPGLHGRHVLPNSLGPALVQATVLMGFAIQIEAALSFLGLGAQPPTPSLGVMLADGRDVLTAGTLGGHLPGPRHRDHRPGASTLVGDGLRRRLDPRGVSR